MKLSKIQKEIIQHRLEVPDAMAEVYEDSYGGDFEKIYNEIDSACNGFIAKLESGATLSSIEKGMAVDIADCQVYVDIAWELVSKGEMSHQKATAIESAQHELYVSFPLSLCS